MASINDGPLVLLAECSAIAACETDCRVVLDCEYGWEHSFVIGGLSEVTNQERNRASDRI